MVHILWASSGGSDPHSMLMSSPSMVGLEDVLHEEGDEEEGEEDEEVKLTAGWPMQPPRTTAANRVRAVCPRLMGPCPSRPERRALVRIRLGAGRR